MIVPLLLPSAEVFRIGENKLSSTKSNAVPITFKVMGMSCIDCTPLITGYLSAQPGVREAAADYEGGKVMVTYQPERTSREDLARAIIASGTSTDWKHEFNPILEPAS